MTKGMMIYMWKVLASIVVLIGLSTIALVYLDGADVPTTEVDVSFLADGNRLEGTLIKPEGDGPFPVVVYVHGDGPSNADLDGAISVYAFPVVRSGYAFFSWSKPGVTGSAGNWLTQSMSDRAKEAADAATFLQSRSDIIGDQIGLMGASQAGWVMPEAISLADFKFMVAISTAVNWRRQGDYMTRVRLAGKPANEVSQALQCNEKSATIYLTSATYADFVARSTELGTTCPNIEDQDLPQEARWQFNRLNISADVTDQLPSISVPVLALFGNMDAHVDVNETIKVYQESMTGIAEEDLTIRLFENADHALIETDKLEPLSFETWVKAIWFGDGALATGVGPTMTDWLQNMKTRMNSEKRMSATRH